MLPATSHVLVCLCVSGGCSREWASSLFFWSTETCHRRLGASCIDEATTERSKQWISGPIPRSSIWKRIFFCPILAFLANCLRSQAHRIQSHPICTSGSGVPTELSLKSFSNFQKTVRAASMVSDTFLNRFLPPVVASVVSFCTSTENRAS